MIKTKKISIPVYISTTVEEDVDVDVDIEDILKGLNESELKEIMTLASRLLPANARENSSDKLFPKAIKNQLITKIQEENNQIDKYT